MISRSLDGRTVMSALGVRFPEAKPHTVSTAPELVEHHPDGARVHAVVPIEPAKRIERAIHIVDFIALIMMGLRPSIRSVVIVYPSAPD